MIMAFPGYLLLYCLVALVSVKGNNSLTLGAIGHFNA